MIAIIYYNNWDHEQARGPASGFVNTARFNIDGNNLSLMDNDFKSLRGDNHESCFKFNHGSN
jgi:hypothetical protein